MVAGRPATAVGWLVLGTVLAGCDAAPGADPNPDGRPNVVIVLVDALRADRLGSYGRPGDPTPRLDALADDGWRWRRAYSAAPSTVRSVASIFTSTAPFVHGIREPPGGDRALSVLPDAMVLLPEPFHDQGYRTAIVTTSGWITPDVNYDQGVDEYRLTGRSDVEVLDAASELLGELAPGPFFLYVHLLDLHDYYHWNRLTAVPGSPPTGISAAMRELAGARPSAIYDALYERPGSFNAVDLAWLEASYERQLRTTDAAIGRLVDRLADLDLAGSTVLVVTSDHGEQFGEHGELVHGGNAFFDEVLRVPLILTGPLPPLPAERFEEPVSTLDLFPTLLELAGIEQPTELAGRSLLDSAEEPPPVLATNERTWKLVEGDWTYIFSRRHEREELYALESDPGELHDLAGERPALVAAMRARLEEAIRRGRRHRYASLREDLVRVPMSDRVEETLESLGYLD